VLAILARHRQAQRSDAAEPKVCRYCGGTWPGPTRGDFETWQQECQERSDAAPRTGGK
jgi:hypothetical protein